MLCDRCETKHVEKNSPDPDFCKQCVREIEQFCESNTMMERMQGLRALTQNSRQPISKQSEVAGFLAILNPHWSQSKLRQMARLFRD